jgi:lactate dehydrogenase-like 2-hydroxyacid dehydrogenase
VLDEGHLAGAGLDVFEREPEVTARLLDLPGVALLPHMGSATVAAREALGLRAVANLRAFFDGRPVLDPVT